jgi:PIN domain nuclease of toxin-antitoxin system
VKLLLDSHVFIWWNFEARKISPSAKLAIAEPTNDVFVSAGTVWELAIKRSLGQIRFAMPIVEAIVACGFQSMAIAGAHAEAAGTLPSHHRDPFDRILIAQVMLEGCVLVTRDRQIEPYGVPCLWT